MNFLLGNFFSVVFERPSQSRHIDTEQFGDLGAGFMSGLDERTDVGELMRRGLAGSI
jgi:hypothetical protein